MRKGNISNNSQIKMFKILFFYKIFHLELKKNPIWQKKNDFQIKLLPSINPRFSIQGTSKFAYFNYSRCKILPSEIDGGKS